jgi:DNA-damage-inducible protein D
MERLEAAKRTNAKGVEYWMARELGPILGYPTWGKFEPVVLRAAAALRADGMEPSHQIAQTSKSVGREDSRDYFLTRAASYLIAMNGEPSKPEIAAAQVYFAAKTRQMELTEQSDALTADEKRLELRDKVTGAVRRVSSAASDAGVGSKRQGIFHDQRWRGLYGASGAQVKTAKGLKGADNLLDRADHLELSAHEFQMNLAANALVNEGVRGEQAAFNKNLGSGPIKLLAECATS